MQDFGFNKTLGTVGWKFRTGAFTNRTHARNNSLYSIKKTGTMPKGGEEFESSMRMHSLPPIEQKTAD